MRNMSGIGRGVQNVERVDGTHLIVDNDKITDRLGKPRPNKTDDDDLVLLEDGVVPKAKEAHTSGRVGQKIELSACRLLAF